VTPPSAQALACVPGLGHGTMPLRLQPLLGGSVNEVYRVDSVAGSFVLRIDGAAWRRPGVNRARELALHRAAAAAGLAPQIVYPPSGQEQSGAVLVTELLAGRLWDERDFSEVPSLQRLGERLATLHQLTPPALPSFDPWPLAQAYVAQIDADHPPVLQQSLQRLQRCCQDVAAEGRPRSIAHGDLWQSNLLQGTALWLLDWEYAQCSDALMDLACVFAYYPQAQRHGHELAAAAGIALHGEAEALAARIYIYRALSWLWHLARGEDAEAP